jgi:hypothetical protein
VLSWTVLGGSPAWPNPGQAASGYLLESEERRMLIDCGSGIAQELRAVNPPPLTDILITHFHADHWFDPVPLHYAFRYGSWRSAQAVAAPAARRRGVLDTVASVWDGSVGDVRGGVRPDRVRPTRRVCGWGPCITFAPVPALHDLLLREDRDAVSRDRILGRHRADRAAGALRPRRRPVRVRGGAGRCLERLQQRGHMDAAEAGREARRAGAKRLLLTHIPEEIGYDFVRERAGAEYKGPIDLAMPGLRIDV